MVEDGQLNSQQQFRLDIMNDGQLRVDRHRLWKAVAVTYCSRSAERISVDRHEGVGLCVDPSLERTLP